MEFKALSNGERSINIISSDGKIVFHVNPQYPLTRLIVDGCMDETLISELGLEGQSRNNKLVKNCLTSESDLIYDCLEKAGLEKIIIAINSSSMTRNNIKTNISLMGEIDSAWDISKRGARIRISIPGFDKQASELKRSIKIEEFEELDLQEFINDVIKSNINEIASNPESVEKANLRSKQYESLEKKKYELAEKEKSVDENLKSIKVKMIEQLIEGNTDHGKIIYEGRKMIDNEINNLADLKEKLNKAKSKADGKVKESAAKMASKAPAEKDDTKSIKIISGKITFRVSPEYPLSRFIIDGSGEGLRIDEKVKEKVQKYCLTSIKKLEINM